MERVKCICSHLGVEAGELGTIIGDNPDDFEIMVKWDNGVKESIQIDDVEFLNSDSSNTDTKMNKIWTLQELTPGTKVLLTNGQIAEFIEMKRVKFVGIIEGKRYKIGADMFVKVVEKADPDAFENIVEKKQLERQNDSDKQKLLSLLKKGDYFYINSGKRQNAELYIFEEIKGNKVIGINPITKARVRIDMSFNYYKL